MDRSSQLSDALFATNGVHRYYSDEVAKTRSMVSNLATQAEPVFVIEAHYDSGFQSSRHCHERDQVSYISEGIISIVTDERTLIVPAGCAIWIPAGVMHQAFAFDNTSLFGIYGETEQWAGLPETCAVFRVSDMFAPLITRIMARQLRWEKRGEPVFEALLLLLYDEIRSRQPLDADVPMPDDRRLRRVCEALLREPSIGHRKDELARTGNMSCRTMTRLFQKELGMTYSDWLQQAFIAYAVARLAKGATVSSVASDLGYRSASAFTAMFRRRVAQPPSDFVERR